MAIIAVNIFQIMSLLYPSSIEFFRNVITKKLELFANKGRSCSLIENCDKFHPKFHVFLFIMYSTKHTYINRKLHIIPGIHNLNFY